MAEGARFELADPLRGLQFSRLARSAAPSPLQLGLFTLSTHSFAQVRQDIFDHTLFSVNPLKPPHIGPQDVWNGDAPIRLLVIFEDGHERAAYREP